jgi:hypothetical protein
MLHNKGTGLSSFVYRTIKQVDTNTRFLYDQVLNSSSWFKRRGRVSPYTRDKSTTDDKDGKCKGYVPLKAPHSLGTSQNNLLRHNWATVFRLDRYDADISEVFDSLLVKSESQGLFRGKIK